MRFVAGLVLFAGGGLALALASLRSGLGDWDGALVMLAAAALLWRIASWAADARG